MSTKENETKKTETVDPFKDWVPEVVEYDEEIDGGGEHLIREDHLAQKEELVDKITQMKQKRRINKVRR